MKLKLLVVFIALSIVSCKIQEVEYRGLKSVKPQNVSLESIVVDAEVMLYNPNFFGFKVLESNIGIYYENEKVAEAKIHKFKIRRKSDADYEITVEGMVLPLFYKKVSFQSLLTGKKLNLKMEGTVKVKKFIFRKNLDVKIEREVSLSDFFMN